MNNVVFGKTMENARKHRNIKLVTTERRRNYLVSEPNYPCYKVFHRKLISYRKEKNQILMNKPIYLGLLILDLSNLFIWKQKIFIKILRKM